MSCSGFSNFFDSGCGGSSSISIPLDSDTGCSGSGRFLHIERGACGQTNFTVHGAGCGGPTKASNEDIVKAFEHIRSNKN